MTGPQHAPGPLLLAGSGEFTPVMNAVDAEVLAAVGRLRNKVAIVPTAAGLEEPDDWIEKGVRHFRALGAEPSGVRAFDAVSAQDEVLARQVEEAAYIYYSGGMPVHVVNSLKGSKVWEATVRRHRQGAALAGCSAGMMMLGGITYNPHAMRHGQPMAVIEGLGLLPRWLLLPHFNNIRIFAGRDRDGFRNLMPPGYAMIGVDEDTALLRLEGAWSVHGVGGVTVWLENGTTLRYWSGARGIWLPGAE